MSYAYGLSLRFRVEINGTEEDWSLGEWTKVENLTVEYDIHEQKEGGLNEYVHRLPGRAKYQNVKLTRPISAASSDTAAWVSKVKSVARQSTATITVLDAAGEEVTAWTLKAVFPARWSGPTLDVGANQVAMETLELAHHGFLEGA